MKTAYLDNDVICGIAKKDLRAEEDAAMRRLLELQSQGTIRLATSDVAKRELAKWHGEKRPDAEAVYEGLQKVKYIEDHMLIGFNNQWSSQGGWSSAMMDDDPVARALWDLGLTRTDSHHLMLAIREQCDFFLTCDQRTVLRRRSSIEAAFLGIRLMFPSELRSEMGCV
jgi:hypothetical protein